MKQLITIITVILFFQSCNKSNDLLNDETCPLCDNFVLIAGDSIDDSLIYIEFKPIILVKGSRTGTSEHYEYLDSFLIDLNNDTENDLKFLFYENVYDPICDSIDEGCCMPEGYAYCKVANLTNFDIACSYDDLLSIYRPSRLNLGDTIDEKLHWISFNKDIEFAIATYPTDWNTAQHDGFMAFRYPNGKDYLYGWIRINTFWGMEIDIYDYAIEKSN